MRDLKGAMAALSFLGSILGAALVASWMAFGPWWMP
jgi:hypothetical protein